MTDHGDDRLAAAQDRAAAAENRAEAAERRYDDPDAGRTTTVKRKPTYGLGSLLSLLAAFAIALSAFLPWLDDVLFGVSLAGSEATIQLLWDTSPTAVDEQPSVLFALLAAVVLILLGTFIPRLRVLSIVGGAVALAAAVLFFITVNRAISNDDAIDSGAFEALGIGVWFAAIGGLVAILGSVLIPRRDVVR